VQESRQHLERRGLARAVGTEESDSLAALNPERHATDGANDLVVALEDRFQRSAHARRSPVHAERLHKILDPDHRETLLHQRASKKPLASLWAHSYCGKRIHVSALATNQQPTRKRINGRSCKGGVVDRR
jgi:hypothetical protein